MAFGEDGHWLLFRNARGALAHLLNTLGALRIWLPAYICAEVQQAAALDGRRVLYYPTGQDFAPDAAYLAERLETGDAVLGVDYFGAPLPDPGLPALARGRTDVTWIQDRAQCLWPAASPWGDYVLYSPRKVVGAPDGGILVSRRGPIAEPAWTSTGDVEHLIAALMRFEDPAGLRNDTWYPAYQRSERSMDAAPHRMSRLSRELVERFDVDDFARRRTDNAAALLLRLPQWAALSSERLLAGAPPGLPVSVDDAAAVAARMADKGIFCARHWADIPSPADQFPVEHQLSRRLLTLPCDHRYAAAEMDRVAEGFEASL